MQRFNDFLGTGSERYIKMVIMAIIVAPLFVIAFLALS